MDKTKRASPRVIGDYKQEMHIFSKKSSKLVHYSAAFEAASVNGKVRHPKPFIHFQSSKYSNICDQTVIGHQK